MSTTTTTGYELGDRVQLRYDHPEAPFGGTVIEQIANGDGPVTCIVRQHLDDEDRRFERFSEADLEPDQTGFVDLDDMIQIRAELADTVASRSTTTGIYASDRAERIRSASRVAFLASRLTWLETMDLIRKPTTSA